jgi:hypothetical protein
MMVVRASYLVFTSKKAKFIQSGMDLDAAPY